MKSKLTIRRTMVATLMVFATAVIGLQPLVFTSGSSCTCDANVSVNADASVDESSCCNSVAEEQAQTGCCSSKPAVLSKCCCNPEAVVCGCGDHCGCSEDSDSNSSLPAIPTNETTEVVTLSSVCAAPFVGYPRESEVKQVDYSNSAAEHAARSSQQTCVLLSRFTC